MKKRFRTKLALRFLAFIIAILGWSFSSIAQFQEGFEGTGTPTGWTVINGGDTEEWEFGIPNNGAAYEGSQVAQIHYDDEHDDYLITQKFTVTQGVSDQLRFYAKNYSSSFIEEFNVLVSTTGNDASAFSDVLNIGGTLSPGITWEEYVFNLSAYIGQDIYIAFHAISKDKFYLYLDDVNVEGAPTCPDPFGITLTGSAVDEATISWTAGASETSWNIAWGTPGFTPGDAAEIGNGTSATNSFTIGALEASSSYDVYVQADCGSGDESTWVGPFTVRTACGEVTSLPYLEEFDSWGTGGDAFPACWERPVVYEGYSANFPSIVSGNAVSTPNSLKFQSDTDEATYAVSPAFAEDIHNLRVRFQLKAESITSSGTMDIGVMSDPTDITTFELVATITPENTSYNEYTYYLNETALSGGGNYIALRHNTANTSWFYWLDDFQVEEIPSCMEPSDITLDDAQEEEVTISWTAGASETSWNIAWGEAGFEPGDAAEIGNGTSATNSFTIGALEASSSYDVYVQADCGSGDESTWVGPFTVRTACGEVTSLPYLEEFDSWGTGGDAFPACWERPVVYEGYSANFPSIVSENAVSTPNSLKFQSEVGEATYAVSPAFAEDINNLRVRFQLKAESITSSGTMDIGVMSDPTDITTFELVATITPENTSYNEYTYYLNETALSGGGNYIALRHNTANTSWFYWLDDFQVEEIPSCMEPSDIALEGMGADGTADISWTAGASETSWNIAWGTPGFTPGDAAEIGNGTSTGENYTIEGLTVGESYDVYVQADCGNGDESIWVGPFSFNLDICEPSSSNNTSDYVSSVVTENALEDLNYSISSGPGTGYIDQTIDTLKVFAGQSFAMNVGYAGGTNTVTAWVNWNEDLMFSNSEVILAGNGSSPQSFTVTVPSSTANGSYQLRVRGMYDYSATVDTLDPCKAVTYGTAVDFILQVVDAPACPNPFNLASSLDFDNEEIVISWTAGNTETSWNIAWGTLGFTPGDAEEIGNGTSTEESYTITNVNIGDTIDVYIQADCGDSESDWVGPITVIFDYCTPEGTNSSRYIDDFTTTQGSVNIDNQGSGFSTGGYGDFTATHKVAQVQGADIDFQAGIVGGNAGFRVWVDWNKDGSFDVSNEVAYQSNDYSSLHSGTINVPLTAEQGEYKMRIVSHWLSISGNVDPCETEFEYGEFEDYILEVIKLEDCAGTPNAGVIMDNFDTCADRIFTISTEGASDPASGLEGQWQESTDGENWADIAGATNSSYTIDGGIEEATYYRYILTCTLDNDASDTTLVLEVGIKSALECYCEVDFPSNVEPITSVIIGDINNQTSDVINGTPASEDFTNLSTAVVQGLDYPIEVKGNTNGSFTSKIVVYIDWNQDGTFDNSTGSDEMYLLPDIYNSTGVDAIASNGTISIPATALEGSTTMRVMKKFSSVADPCNTSGYGQAEDYTIIVAAPQDCSGTPDVGTIIDDFDICENTPFTISTSASTTDAGLEGQWQESTDGENWTDITGATGSSYTNTEGISEETYYRYVLTCTLDNDASDTTATLTVGILGIEDCGCTPEDMDCSDGDVIYNVTFGDIYNNTDCSPAGYGDYTDQSTTVFAGDTYTVSVTVGDGWYERVSLFIDFDQNGWSASDFITEIGDGGNGVTLTEQVTIPAGVAPGSYRMRFMVVATGEEEPAIEDPCIDENFGEIEDYTLIVDESLSLKVEGLEGINVYPNPASTVLNISADMTSNYKVEMFDVNGRVVLTDNNTMMNASQGTIHIDHLERGVYTLKIYSDEGDKTFKVIKQ